MALSGCSYNDNYQYKKPSKVWTYLDIELAIVDLYPIRQHIIIPNCYVSYGTVEDHECDLLIIKRSGYAVEIEIKMSKADFKNDFKKKHSHVNEILQHLYYAMPEEVYNKCKDLIPEYAGVYCMGNDGRTKLIKEAPKKVCRKLSVEEQLKFARLGCLRIWNLKKKINK